MTLHTSSYGTPGHSGWLDITPGDRRVSVGRTVTLPRPFGPRLRRIACDRDGFISTDAHGRRAGLDGVFAAGDATSFSVRQGGLAGPAGRRRRRADRGLRGGRHRSAAVQADPARVLLTGGPPRYLQADISGRSGDDSTISGEALWWPPNKLAGRYLAPYLSRQVGERLDVMPQGEHAIPIETAIDPASADTNRGFGELVRSTVPLTVAPSAHTSYLDGVDGEGRLTSRKTLA